MSLRDELEVLQREWERETGKFQNMMEARVTKEASQYKNATACINGWIRETRESGHDCLVVVYTGPSEGQEEVILTEDWLEREGYEYHLDEEWNASGKKRVLFTINLSP